MARHEGTILIRKKGLQVPEAAFKKMLEASSAPWGCAFAADGVLQAQWETDPNTVKGLMDIQDAYSGQDLVYYFGKYPNNFDEDDLQPYVALGYEDKDDPMIFAFMEGDFENHTMTDNPLRADAYYALENVVTPELEQLREVLNGDITKIMTATEKPMLHRKFSTLCRPTGRGTLVLLGVDGSMKVFSHNMAWKEFEWGSMSSSHGYTEQTFPEKAAAATETKPTGFRTQKTIKPATVKTAQVAQEQQPARVQEAAPPPPVGVTPPPLTDTAIHMPVDMDKIMCPADLSNKEFRNWLKGLLGVLPQGREGGWREIKKRGYVMIPKGKGANTKKDGPITAKSFQEAQQILSQKDKAERVPIPEKNVEPQHIAATTSVPIVPAIQKREFETKFLKRPSVAQAIDGTHAPMTLAEIDAIERNTLSYSEVTGRHLEQTFRILPEDLMELTMNYPHLTVALLCSYRNSLMKMLAEQRPASSSNNTGKIKQIKPATVMTKAG